MANKTNTNKTNTYANGYMTAYYNPLYGTYEEYVAAIRANEYNSWHAYDSLYKPNTRNRLSDEYVSEWD